ncbi:hypothetical protein [Oceanirhabdus seepicola]|uniref:YhfM-like domain-containing protein n=1 Tax=Oceanirhabdus seepicola TaxID=2828781 RepID=A0A9J6P1Y4_9CLOT|nr:hypothetical protein [Oceanirhabdus seepicola]MCM1989893.1 hypothetical protein [Oceanirhabdus seepicola]
MFKRFKFILMIIITCVLFTSCGVLDDVFIKVGFKNDRFEYINEGNVTKVVIQSVRDKNFKFIITDKTVLDELYDILSKAKGAEESSTLNPDFIFELHLTGNKVEKYYYIAGLDKENKGNFYNEDEKYIVSKRLDNDLLDNFFNIRTPIKFSSVYYDSIIEVLDIYRESFDSDKINVYLNKDRESAKFILSIEEEEFKGTLENKYDNVVLNQELGTSAIDMVVSTVGYKSTIIKMKIEFKQKGNILKEFYVLGNYENKKWVINVYKDKKPSDF